MMIYSLPAPFFLDRPLDHDKLRDAVAEGVTKLASTGVSFIAIPCNTVHAYFDHLQSRSTVPLLHIARETLRTLGSGPSHVALLATRATVQAQLYQRGLEAAAMTCVWKEEWQEQVDGLLHGIKVHVDGMKLAALWSALVSDLQKDAIDGAILACTDLNVVAAASSPFPLIDATANLAKAVVREYLAP
jgi:aspartate racemase